MNCLESVDSLVRILMVSQKRRSGILAGGNWIIDQVKLIDVFPQPESLANILRQEQGSGGSPYNVLIDLAKLGAPFPLMAAGLVGKDTLGQQIRNDCRSHKINTRFLDSTDQAPTSYTDVMTEINGGRRTFFHDRGANALWKGENLDFAKCKSRIFHLGYLLLLDALDAPDKKFGTRAARLLAKAQKAGMKTSVDVVSEDSDRFLKIVSPALKHVNYLIINEIEAGKTANCSIRNTKGKLNPKALERSADILMESGAAELIIIHFPEGALAISQSGELFRQPSLKISSDNIAGSAGAGDAFCAGVLFGLHEGWEIQRCLYTGVCSAAVSLSHPTCSGGLKSLAATLRLGKKHSVRDGFH